MNYRDMRRALTLLELIVVVSIIALLAGLLVPAISAVRESSRNMQCMSNLRQIGLAMHNYESAHRRLPPAMIWHGRGESRGGGVLPIGTIDHLVMENPGLDRLGVNWLICLLPYLEQSTLYDRFDKRLPLSQAIIQDVVAARMPVLICPSDVNTIQRFRRGLSVNGIEYARGNYAINLGNNLPCFFFQPNCDGGYLADTNDLATAGRIWGSGVAGFNVAFRLADFPEGLSSIIAVDEIRSGVAPNDSRGTWAHGMIGSSMTALSYEGPNSEDGDLIEACGSLTIQFGESDLQRQGMPCSLSVYRANLSATARSMHRASVNTIRLDGSVHSIQDTIDPVTWTTLHARDVNAARRVIEH